MDSAELDGAGMTRVAGVLLAAGRSLRMGQPKPLVPLAGRPLCVYAASALAGAEHAALLAVIPPGEVGAGIRTALAPWPFEFAENPDPGRGLLSSFQVAAAHLPAGLDAANFALADMPLLTPAVHAAMLAAFEDRRPPLVLARYGAADEGVQAPPHLFRADLLSEILALPAADQGPRPLVQRYRAGATVLPFPAELLLDVDTPEALAEAEKFLSP